MVTSIPISCSRADTHLKNDAYRSAVNAALQHVSAHGERVSRSTRIVGLFKTVQRKWKTAIYMSVLIFVAVVGVDIYVLLLIRTELAGVSLTFGQRHMRDIWRQCEGDSTLFQM